MPFLPLSWILKENNWQKELAETSFKPKGDCAFRMLFTIEVCSSLHSSLMQLIWGTWFQCGHASWILTAFTDLILNTGCSHQRRSLAKLNHFWPNRGLILAATTGGLPEVHRCSCPESRHIHLDLAHLPFSLSSHSDWPWKVPAPLFNKWEVLRHISFSQEAIVFICIFSHGETEALRYMTNVPRRPKCCWHPASFSRALAQKGH